jgi:hypothetical protein
MYKRDELSILDSCWNKANDDEMLFVLLGRDVAAPAAVRAWIAERIRLRKNGATDAKIAEAERWIETVLNEQRAGKALTGDAEHLRGLLTEMFRSRPDTETARAIARTTAAPSPRT